MKRLFTLLSCYLFINTVYSQSPVGEWGICSPNTASLGTINEVPVSLYTGKCNITIPIYELKEGDITVPVYLNYNSSGIKPKVHGGWVGLNWTLQAGGIITRTVKGIPDETTWKRDVEDLNPPITIHLSDSNGYLHNFRINSADNWDSSANIQNKAAAAHWIESAPDEFTFNINGNSGTFYIGEDRKIYCQSSPEIKVEIGKLQRLNYPNFKQKENRIADPYRTYKNLSNEKISGFKITMPDGTEYEFGYYSEPYSADRLLIEYSLDFFAEIYEDENWNTWLLRKIKSPNGSEVTFNYQHGQSSINNSVYNHPVASFNFNVAFERYNAKTSGILGNFKIASSSNLSEKYTGEIMFPVYLSSIESNTQRLDFSKSISKEQVYSYEEIKDELQLYFNYIYGYFEGISPRSFLVDKTDYEDNTIEMFNLFQWFKLDEIGLYSKLISQNVKKWKFSYNNDITEKLMLLSLQEVGIKYDGTFQENNPYTFEYEDYYGTDKYPGTYKLPVYNTNMVDHWGYYNNRISRFYKDYPIDSLKSYYTRKNTDANYLYTGQLNIINYPLGGSVEFTYEPNKYSTMIKRDSSTGYFISKNYTTPITGGGLRIKNIKYKDNGQVKLEKNYIYSNGILGHEIRYYWPKYQGKLLHQAVTYTCERFVKQDLIPLYGCLDYSISYPKVEEHIPGLGKTEYYYSNHLSNPDEKYINTIDIQKSIMSPYSTKDFERGKLLRKITRDASSKIKKIEHYKYSKNNNVSKEYIRAVATKQIPLYDDYVIEGSSYKIYTYPYVLTCSIDSTFDINGSNPVVSKTDYKYNSYNFLSESSSLRSDGKKQSEKYYYPFEITEGADTAVLRKMTSMNILSGYRDKIVCLDSTTVIKGEYRKYKEFFPNVFRPEQVDLVQSKTTLNSWRSLLKPENYYKYNNHGNIVEYKSARSNTAITYLWSYKYQYPIVEIKNATYGQVKGILGESYINYLANSSVPDWLTLKVKDLPYKLPNSQVSYHDYKHLIGLNSNEDARGVSKFYDYDRLGRLISVADNGFKTIENNYHLKNPNTAFYPNVTFTNNVNTGTLTYSATLNTSIGGTNTYYWDFGDGSTSNIQSGNHSYSQPGTYILKCKVVNPSKGLESTRSFVLEFPHISVNPNIELTCNDEDPYYIKYNCKNSYNLQCNYTVNSTDGSPQSTSSSGAFTNKSGTFTITVTATHPFHGTASETKIITLNNIHAYWDIRPHYGQELLEAFTVGVDIGDIPTGSIAWYETTKRDLNPNMLKIYYGPEYITHDYEYEDCTEIEVYCVIGYGGVYYRTNTYGYVR